MTTELKKITWHDDGNLDVGKIIANIETVRDAVDETERQRLSHEENMNTIYPPGITYIVEARGDHVALAKAVRAEMRLQQVFVTAGTDGEAGLDTQIELLKNATEPLCEAILLKATEGRGKTVIGTILTYPTITAFDEIVIRSDTERRIVCNMNFGGV